MEQQWRKASKFEDKEMTREAEAVLESLDSYLDKEVVYVNRDASGVVRLRYHQSRPLPDSHPLLIIRRACAMLTDNLRARGLLNESPSDPLAPRDHPQCLLPLLQIALHESATSTTHSPLPSAHSVPSYTTLHGLNDSVFRLQRELQNDRDARLKKTVHQSRPRPPGVETSQDQGSRRVQPAEFKPSFNLGTTNSDFKALREENSILRKRLEQEIRVSSLDAVNAMENEKFLLAKIKRLEEEKQNWEAKFGNESKGPVVYVDTPERKRLQKSLAAAKLEINSLRVACDTLKKEMERVVREREGLCTELKANKRKSGSSQEDRRKAKEKSMEQGELRRELKEARDSGLVAEERARALEAAVERLEREKQTLRAREDSLIQGFRSQILELQDKIANLRALSRRRSSSAPPGTPPSPTPTIPLPRRQGPNVSDPVADSATLSGAPLEDSAVLHFSITELKLTLHDPHASS